MITSKQLRSKWLSFYESKGHVNIGAVSLIGDGSTGVMFNVAGMQPLMPYLLGQPHPAGKRLCNVQGCVRTVDIESVGDATHFTFFEMMGNWSLGDYFKKEKTAWSFELLTKEFGLDPDKICSTVFAGNESVPRDDETAQLLISLGIRPEHIYYLDKSNNWWELEGTVGTPCGPDNEWFYPLTDEECGRKPCDINCPCGRYVEIGNDVYMQYKKTADGYVPLENKNVDTGFGLDRMLAFLNGLTDGYKTDLFSGAISYLEKVSGKKVRRRRRGAQGHAHHRRSYPHHGHAHRRRQRNPALQHGRGVHSAQADAPRHPLLQVARHRGRRDVYTYIYFFIEEVYGEAYPLLPEKEGYILEEIGREIARFESTLEKGMKEFEKTLAGIERKNEFMAKQNPDYVKESVIGGKAAFKLYDTYGFPLELTVEMAAERGYTVDEQGFNEAFKEHQEKSHVVAEGQFKGGLADTGVATTRLHTATHLLNAALKQVLSPDVNQKGSNVTPERLRFDFNFPRPMTQEEIAAVEKLVNEKIAENIPVVYEEMPYEQARAEGIVGVFDNKYGDVVKTYSIGNFSREMCGGPHAASTGELGHFKIVKEQSSASGIRRIKAILE